MLLKPRLTLKSQVPNFEQNSKGATKPRFLDKCMEVPIIDHDLFWSR